MSVDLKEFLQKRKPAKRRSQLAARPRRQLIELGALPGGAPLALLLDANVYTNQAAGRLATPVRDAIDQALLFHCSVALAELAAGVANADPARPEWPALRDHYSALFAAIRQAGC